MTAAPQFLAGAEGFDIYAAGVIGAAFPWYVDNASFAGAITASVGAFGGNALKFAVAASNTAGMEYQFPSTMQVMRSLGTAGGSGAFGVCGWISLGTATGTVATDILMAIGTSALSTELYPLIGQSYSVASGLQLVFPSTVVNLTTTPNVFAVTPNTYYWVGVYFSYSPTGVMKMTVTINGATVFTDLTITWAADQFVAGQIVNRLKLYSGVVASWMIDDMIIQAVSSADTLYPGGTPTPETIPQFSPRQISLATATGNGTVNQWAASGAEPNWQSATDPTGVNYVVASAANQSDRYKWTTSASDIKAVIYKGKSNRYAQVSPVSYNGTTQTTMATTNGPSEFIGISENDGTNLWTAASIGSGEFGQISHN